MANQEDTRAHSVAEDGVRDAENPSAGSTPPTSGTAESPAEFSAGFIKRGA